MSSRRTVAELLRDLAAVMVERDVSWYLFGAQAAIIWGSPRLSGDVDITAVIEPALLDRFIKSMQRHGFDPVFNDPDFLARTRVVPFVHRPTRMPLDVVLAGPGLEEDFLSRAIQVDVDDAHIPVISPEDLIITKILAGRPKDVEDVRSVAHERRKTLDIERIRETLHFLERALSQSDLLPVFEDAWARAESSSVRPLKRPGRRPRKK